MSDWKIPYRSGIVGVVVFVVIDILCLWLIHRGLMAIQAYTMIRKVRRNESLRLKRSTIPIVSGELLESSTVAWSFNWLVMANVTAIFIALLVSFGIDGETVQKIERRMGDPLLYQTALSDMNSSAQWGTNQPVVRRCRKEQSNTVMYYPMAFNVTWNAHLHDFEQFRVKNGSDRFIDTSSTVCQWNLSPILVITNCSQCRSYFRSNAIESNVTFYNETESTEIGGHEESWFTWNYFKGKNEDQFYIRTVKSSLTQDLRPSNRLFCLTKRKGQRTLTLLFKVHCIIVRDTNRTMERTIAYGQINDIRGSLGNATYTFRRISSFGIIHNISQFRFIGNALHDIIPTRPYSLVDIADRILYGNVIAEPISLVTIRVPVTITVVKPMASRSIIALIVIAVLLGPCQELLTYISRRQYGISLSRLMQVNRFDALSTWLPDFLAPDSLPEHGTYSQISYENSRDASFPE